MLKPHSMLIHVVNKIKTENGAIPLADSIKLLNDFWNLAKKHGFEAYIKGQKPEFLEYTPTGKTYHIKTLEDIAALTEQQFEMFIEDLRSWTIIQRNVTTLENAGIEIEYEKGMIWLDSGLHEAKVNVNITGTNKL